MREKWLYGLWERGLKGARHLKTRSGNRIRLVSPGKRNPSSGPDYRGCILEVDGDIWVGDVEIHVKEGDWWSHGHQEDTAFGGLLLHICASDTPESDRETGTQWTLVLDRQEEEMVPRGKAGRSDVNRLCSAGRALVHHPDRASVVLSHLENNGRRRIYHRVQRLEEELSRGVPLKDVLFRCLLLSFGLHRNRQPMETLVEHLDRDAFHRTVQEQDPDLRQRVGEGYLLKSAGLLTERNTGLFSSNQVEWSLYLGKVEEALKEQSESSAGDLEWCVDGIRPANSPYRRMAGFVTLYRRHLLKKGVREWLEEYRQRVARLVGSDGSRAEAVRELLSPLIVRADEEPSFWNDYSAPAAPLKQSMGLVGEHRAAVLWVNSMLPFLLAVALKRGAQGFRQDLERGAMQYPLPLEDHRTKRVQTFLFAEDASALPMTAYIEQGMHELYKTHCRYGAPGCERCPLRGKLNGKGTVPGVCEHTMTAGYR